MRNGFWACPADSRCGGWLGPTLWYLVLEVPEGSRINYQIEVRRGDHVERFNDPLNPKLSHSPFGAVSVCFSSGYITPDVDLSG